MSLKQITNLFMESGACWVQLAEVVMASIVSDCRSVPTEVLAGGGSQALLQLIQVGSRRKAMHGLLIASDSTTVGWLQWSQGRNELNPPNPFARQRTTIPLSGAIEISKLFEGGEVPDSNRR